MQICLTKEGLIAYSNHSRKVALRDEIGDRLSRNAEDLGKGLNGDEFVFDFHFKNTPEKCCLFVFDRQLDRQKPPLFWKAFSFAAWIRLCGVGLVTPSPEEGSPS